MKVSARLLTLLWLVFALPAAAADLVADISSTSIEVTSGFTGTSLTVFGALDKPPSGEDIVVTVTGPQAPVSVRRKVKHYGLWVNGDAVAFPQAPGFYALASTQPLANQDSGPETLTANPADASGEFRAALIHLKQALALYSPQNGKVRVEGGRLFRADFNLPANVPMGVYTVHISVVRDGAPILERALPLTIDEGGFAAMLRRAVYHTPFLYAFSSLALIFVIGFVSAAFTRKGE